MSGFGWYRVYDGPLMLRPGTDLKRQHARQRRVCEVCESTLGLPMVFDGPPDAEDFDCFYCGAVYGEERLKVVS
jgi:hypothetical protein